jgi:hypothetical protein
MTTPKTAETIDTVIAAATQNAGRGGDLVMAAGQVVAKRVALGVAAAVNPMAADHAEFGRMVPEKMEAMSAAGMIMLAQSTDASFEITRRASDEVMQAAAATIEMAGCTDPMAVVEAQSKFAIAWFDRAAANAIAMGMLALRAHDAAMEPIRDTVAANTERLG